MTGKSYSKTRVFLSDKFASPISRKSLEDAAKDFRRVLNGSSLRSSLNPNIAVKALPNAKSNGNTDGKKRTNTGSVPGVENFGGYRYNPKQKGEPGKVFKPFVSYAERINPRLQTANWGWVDREKNEPLEEKKSHIRIRRYSVDKRTGEVNESTEEELDRLTVSGMPLELGMQEKRLPGQTIGEMMRGGSLVARAAKAIGVLTDADGRLRCPPGTPAANQFTDSIGSNCFGFSASELVGMARQFAGYIDALDDIDSLEQSRADSGLASGAQAPIRNNAKGWGKLIGDKIKTAGQFAWKDRFGRDQQPSEWEIEEEPGMFNWFKNGAKRGRKSLRDMHDRTNAVKTRLGVGEPTTWDKNSDLIEVFDKLRQTGVVTTQFVGRPQTEAEVLAVCEQSLKSLIGPQRWRDIPDADKAALLREEMKNYFTAERAMLEQVLKSYSEMPSHMRTVDEISWKNKLPQGSEAMAVWDLGGGMFGKESSYIDICMPQILANARHMLPPLEEYQRLRIDALGGGSDAENATELNDFLVSAHAYSKETAALIGGLESFARHVMAHEISHTTQFRAIIEMTKRQVNADGSFTLPNGRTITSWNDITNQEWQEVMGLIKKDPNWLVDNLREMNDVIERANAAQWLAGKYIYESYPEDSNPIVRALEITAELGALREQGIIHGQVVDDALAFMDAYVDRRFNEERGISDTEETARFIDLIDNVESGAVQLNTSQEMIDAVNKRNEDLEKARIKKEIQDQREYFDGLDEEDLVDEIANLEFEYEKLDEIAANNPKDNQAAMDAKNAKESLGRAKQAWRDKTGLDNRSLDRRVAARRDELDLMDQESLNARRKRAELEKIASDAENSSQEDLITRLAYIKTKLKEEGLSQETREKLEKARKIYRDEYRKKAKDSGDDSSTQKLNREIDKLVENRIAPPKQDKNPLQTENPEAPKTKTKKPKPVKTPKNKAATTKHVNNERENLFEESTPREMTAIMELSDPDDKDIALLLDPATRDEAIDRIRARNDALNDSAAYVDPYSSYDASLEQQMENILMPSLDLIDRSSLQESVQVEATIDLTDEQLNGESPINIDGLISGRLITGDKGISKGDLGEKDETTGKKPHRVVIQAEEGQKGYYPHWSDSNEKEPKDFNQKVVFPPGELEVVEVRDNPDGSKTVVARIKRQKGTEEILDGILSGEGSENIPPGARADIEKAVNKHIVDRRNRGIHSDQITPADTKKDIDNRNNSSLDIVNEDGGSFGTNLDSGYIESVDLDPDAPGQEESDVFGPVETAAERRETRAEDLADVAQRIKEVSETGEADEELGISPEDIDPEILAILNEMTPQQIEEALADEAEKVHNEIDKRPRVVVDEEDLEDIIEEAANESKTTQWWESSGKEIEGASRETRIRSLENNLRNLRNELIKEGQRTAEEYGAEGFDFSENTSEIISLLNDPNIPSDQFRQIADEIEESGRQVFFRDTPGRDLAQKIANDMRRHADLIDRPEQGQMPRYPSPTPGTGTSSPRIRPISRPGAEERTPQVPSFRGSGLSSGSSQKIGTVSDGPIERVSGKRKVDDPDKSGRLTGTKDQEVNSDVYQIGDEKLVFGSESIDDPSLKVLPINPYEISGLKPESEEGRKAALLWFSATVGSMAEQTGRNKDGGKTSALLYAASRGDSDAQAELERLAKIGDEKMKETLKVNDDFMQRFDGSTREEREADGGKWWQFNHGDAMVYYNDEKGDRISRPFELDDLHMVHQTSFEPTVDQDGNLVLKPAEDFDYINPLTGEVQLDPVTGKPYEIYRGSMHFSLNHLVEGHIYRPIPTSGTWAVVIPARSMIESNPGALDNLYSVDTFLTPRPGEGLKIPAGQFKIVKLPGIDVDRESPEFKDAAIELEKQSQKIVNDALQEIGVQHTGKDGYKTPIFAPGMHGSSAGVDRRMRDIAFDQGVSSMKHDGHPISRFEQINTLARYRDIPMSFSDSDYTTLGYMSENARMRVANNNRFSNAADKEDVIDSGLFSGARPSRLSTVGNGFSARAARTIVGRVLDSRDDIDDDTKEKLLLASEVVASYAAKGPTGALTRLAMEAARRGGREVAELSIQKLVDSGKIGPEEARKAMQAVDRVAPNGLPDPVKEKLIDGFEAVDEFIGERVLTDENKERLMRATDEARERASEMASQARETVGDAAKKAKEKTRGALDRLKKRKESMRDIPSVDDVIYDTYSVPDQNDPFSIPPSPEQSSPLNPVASIFDDPFGSPSPQMEEQSETQSGRQRLLRRLSDRRNSSNQDNNEYTPNTKYDPDDPFVGLSSGGNSRNVNAGSSRSDSSIGLSSGRAGRKLERVGRPERGQDSGNSTDARNYVPVSDSEVEDIVDSNPFSMKAKRGGGKKIAKTIEKAGIDWNKQRDLQQSLQKTIDESPEIRKFINQFGMPPVFALEEMPQQGFLDTGSAWSGTEGVFLPELGIIAVPSSRRLTSKYGQDHILRHELTHAFHAMARARNKEAREIMADNYQEVTENIKRLSKERGVGPQAIIDAVSFGDDEAAQAFSGLTPDQRQEALQISNYAATNMVEFIAEAIAFATSPDPRFRQKVSDRAVAMIAPYFGMSVDEMMRMLGRSGGNAFF